MAHIGKSGEVSLVCGEKIINNKSYKEIDKFTVSGYDIKQIYPITSLKLLFDSGNSYAEMNVKDFLISKYDLEFQTIKSLQSRTNSVGFTVYSYVGDQVMCDNIDIEILSKSENSPPVRSKSNLTFDNIEAVIINDRYYMDKEIFKNYMVYSFSSNSIVFGRYHRRQYSTSAYDQ